MLITPPAPHEYAPHYATYISKVQQNNLLEALQLHTQSFTAFIQNIPEEKSNYAYAPGKWTVKEILLHLIDAERIFAYRALRFARNDSTALPGFDENAYVPYSHANSRTLTSIIEEFTAVRQATLTLFNNLEEAAFMRTGTASNKPITVRAIGYAIIGHAQQYKQVIAERYLKF